MPKNTSAFADISIAPLVGRFDVRSTSGNMPVGDFRIVLNSSMNELGKRCRRPGWRKYGTGSQNGFNNQDLHDQLIGLQYSYGYGYDLTDDDGDSYLPDCREAITHLAAVGSDDTFRTLIAATKNSIYASNDYTGNWRLLGNGFGGAFNEEEDCLTCNSRRFRSAQLGNYVLFTNNFDPILSWRFGDPPESPTLWSVEYVTDLVALGLTKARCVTTFSGFSILGNVELEGHKYSSRIYWSDFNSPLSWLPGDTSLANYHEFGLDERVLRIEPLGKYLMVYTDKSVYQGVLVNDSDLVFSFNEIPTESPLRFEHSLVNTGRVHAYVSDNGVYTVSSSDPRPTRIEWIHRADGVIFNGLPSNLIGDFAGLDPISAVNEEQCDQFVGGYNPTTQEIWFSWPTGESTCPTVSLVLNLRYEAADLVDHGFTAFASYKPDYRPSIREWLNNEGVCPVSVSDFIQEGLPATLDPPGDAPTYLWNAAEDPTQPIDPDSWCARLGDTTVDDLCDACEGAPLFLMADASDFTIKEWNTDTFFREQFDGEDWSQEGYYTLLQSDLHNLSVDEEKQIKQVLIDYDAEEQEPPSDLLCDVAFGAQPRCAIWVNIGTQELRCLTDSDAAEHAANNTRPSLVARYNTLRRGRYLGYRFYTSGVGGAACFSRVTLTASKVQARTH